MVAINFLRLFGNAVGAIWKRDRAFNGGSLPVKADALIKGGCAGESLLAQ